MERAQWTGADDFYEVTESPFDIADVKEELTRWEQITYNTGRRHQTLGYSPPFEFMQLGRKNEERRLCVTKVTNESQNVFDETTNDVQTRKLKLGIVAATGAVPLSNFLLDCLGSLHRADMLLSVARIVIPPEGIPRLEDNP